MGNQKGGDRDDSGAARLMKKLNIRPFSTPLIIGAGIFSSLTGLRYGPRIVEGLLHKLLAAERVEDVEVGSTKAWQISKTPPPYTL